MPINESQGHPGNLTPQQQREAVREVYGLAGKDTMSPNNLSELTYEERIKMRRYLDSLDAKEAGGLKDFDLNKPTPPPYVYREYPRLMYQAGGAMKTAHNFAEHQQLLTEGWSETPVVQAAVPEAVDLTPEELAEASVVDRKLREKKK